MLKLSEFYQDYTHVLMIPGFSFEQQYHLLPIERDHFLVYEIDEFFHKDDLSFFDPFSAFFVAMYHADLWPGVLVFHHHKQSLYHYLHKRIAMNL